MSNITVTGMVISSMPIGEYDRRIELLTAEWGRIGAFARGARKPSSELVSVSRVFATGRFELFQGKSSYTLKSAKISNYFTELASDIDLTYFGFYFLELARYFSRENVEATESLNLLYAALRALGSGKMEKTLVRSVYEMKTLQINGLCPPPGEKAAEEMDPSTVYALNFVYATPPGKLFSFMLSEKVKDEFTAVADRLMALNVDKKFKSLEFI